MLLGEVVPKTEELTTSPYAPKATQAEEEMKFTNAIAEKPDEKKERFLRREEVCFRTGYSRASLERLKARGLFPLPIRVAGGAYRYLESDIDRWMEEQQARGKI